MVHKASPERILSIKTKLLLIALMFVVINLIFYFGFDSSDEPNETEKSTELDDTNQLSSEKNVELDEEIGIRINP